MSIRVGQNSGVDSRLFGGIRPNTAGKANNRLMSRGIWGQQSGMKKDVAQFASQFYGNQKKDATVQRMETNAWYPGRIAQESADYARSLNNARASSRKTSTQVKKLQYNYKAISTQILGAKTSLRARQVVLKARRMVAQLKRQKGKDEYDEGEVELAITHAQAMERVARKRERHLREEELVKVTGGFCEGELREEDIEDREGLAAEEQAHELPEDGRQVTEESMEQMMEEFAGLMEEYQQMAGKASDEMMAEYQKMMEEAMREMMEDSGLSELADEMFSAVDSRMDPADYNMMKLKHRQDEMRAIARADSAYLKALFEKYEQDRGKSLMPLSGGGSPGVNVDLGSLAGQGFTVSMSDGSVSAGCVGASVDVSL